MYLYALDLDLHYLPIQSEHQRKYIIYKFKLTLNTLLKRCKYVLL